MKPTYTFRIETAVLKAVRQAAKKEDRSEGYIINSLLKKSFGIKKDLEKQQR